MHEMNTKEISEALGLKTEAGFQALRVALENIKLLDSKQLDYGSASIGEFGEFGVLVRCFDKVHRLKNLHGQCDVFHESVSDSWQDLANYALIAQLCHAGQWPVD